MKKDLEIKIGIIGLGYVGLPLAIEFSKKYKTTGFDINKNRISELNHKLDVSGEIDRNYFETCGNIKFTYDESELLNCDVYIITVPTPIDDNKKPDLSALISATTLVANLINKDDLVIYESTVYPGATEEVCVPILEQEKGYSCNQDFLVAYSPERINPGDKEHSLKTVVKVVSGSNLKALNLADQLYSSIVTAGTYRASSIKIAEAAKVIENTQRDINIALVNELAKLFNKMKIDTYEVLEAAGSKWNFMPFTPGLVGGHCIGVDPYYLTAKASQLNINTEMILAGRKTNEGMANYIASALVNRMNELNIVPQKSRVLIMGFTFKENCSDIRNTKVFDLYKELEEYGIMCDVTDPICNVSEVESEYKITIINEIRKNFYDGVILAVKHNEYSAMAFESVNKLVKRNGIIYDLKNIYKNNSEVLKL